MAPDSFAVCNTDGSAATIWRGKVVAALHIPTQPRRVELKPKRTMQPISGCVFLDEKKNDNDVSLEKMNKIGAVAVNEQGERLVRWRMC